MKQFLNLSGDIFLPFCWENKEKTGIDLATEFIIVPLIYTLSYEGAMRTIYAHIVS